MNSKNTLLYLMLWAFCLPVWAQAQTWTNYNPRSGSINSLAIDAQGNKWCAAENGVSKFDGTTWTAYNTSNGLAGGVTSIVIDAQNNKWFGTTNGVSKFDGTAWTTYNESNGLAANLVYSIAIDAQGNKWFGTISGISKFDGTTWTTYNIYNTNGLADDNVRSIAIDAQDNKWFGTTAGVSKFDGTTWTSYNTSNGLVGNGVSSITIDAQGNKWFGTPNGVSKFDGTTWTTYNTSNGLVNNFVFSIAIDAQGNKWFGTFNGVSKFDGTTWTTYNTSNGLANNIVSSVAIDAQGNKWCGTDDGLSKFDGTAWTTYHTPNNLVNNSIYSIVIDGQGNKWFGTGDGISKFDGTAWTTYNTSNGLVNNFVRCIAIDAQGNKWFGTNNGISKFDGTVWTSYNTSNGLVSNEVYSIAIDAQGNKWFGTNNGVSKFDGTTWTTYNESNGLVSNYYVLSIVIDAQGNKWFGTGGGISKFNGTTWTTYNTSNGLVDNYVGSIAIDAQGNKWFGTVNGRGVSKFDGTTWTTYNNSNGLASNSVPSIAIDAQGNKWFGTRGGISKFDGTTWTTYKHTDGSVTGLVSNNVQSIAIDAQGNKWIGTYINGVSKFSTNIVNLQGNNINIGDGKITPSTADNTNFGTIAPNSTTTKTFTIQNTGIDALSVTGITFTGTNASEFTVVSPPSYPLSIAASGSQTITVRFAPTATGTRTATLNITNNSSNAAVYDVALQGTILPLLPTATISGTTTVCQPAAPTGFDITFKATSGTAPFVFTYNINGGSNINTTSSSSNTVVVSHVEGNPSITVFNLVSVTDAAGTQSQTGSATITINAQPTVAPTPINICLNGYEPIPTTTIDLTSYENTVNNSGGNTFEWFSIVSGNLTPISTPNNFTTSTSIVNVQVTNTISGCTNGRDLNINVNNTPNPVLLPTTVCVGQTTALPNLGAGTILWYFPFSTPNIAEFTVTTTESVKGLSAGTTYMPYQVTNGYCTFNGSQLITVNPLPTATISGTKTVNIHAPNPEITFAGVVGTGAFIFTYTINGGAEQTTNGTVAQSTATIGTFVYDLLKVEDVNGCSQTQTGSATITVAAVLPTELTTFTAHPLSTNVQLNWQTASEKNNVQFDIERSNDSKIFSKIGEIKGHGTTNEVQNYAYLDTKLLSGVNYYRLKQIDTDGHPEYSKTISVEFRGGAKTINVYPNPMNDHLTIETNFQDDYTIELFDITGKLLQSQKTNQTTMQLTTSNLPNGIYMVSVKSNFVQQTFKIVK